MKGKRNRLGRYVFAWGAILVLTVGSLMVTIQSNNASEIKEKRVDIASRSNIESLVVPPIDKVVPPIIETASFGLG